MKAKLLNSKLGSSVEPIINQADPTQSYLMNQLLTPQDLEIKKSAISNRTYSDPETERDFRRTCELYEKQNFNPQLKKAYKEYKKSYHKITSLYSIQCDSIRIYLYIFTKTLPIKNLLL